MFAKPKGLMFECNDEILFYILVEIIVFKTGAFRFVSVRKHARELRETAFSRKSFDVRKGHGGNEITHYLGVRRFSA